MKLSIKFFAMIVLFFSIHAAANAQRGGQRPDPEQRAERQTNQMVEHLDLDETQAAKVKEIHLTYGKKMSEARGNNQGDREAMKEAAAAIRKEKNAELKLVLSESQFKSYEEMLSNRSGRRGEKGKRNGGR